MVRTDHGAYKGYRITSDYFPDHPEQPPFYRAIHLSDSSASLHNRTSLEGLKAEIDELSTRPKTYTLRSGSKEVAISSMQGKYMPEDLDPEIIPLIVDLNAAGFQTLASCAGHSTRGDIYGIVSIKGADPDTREIQKVLKAHGLSIARIERKQSEGRTRILFPAFGK